MSVVPGSLDGQRVLILLHGSIGDVIRGIPLANLLKRHFPTVKIEWSAESPAAELLRDHPSIDEVIVFDRQKGGKAILEHLGELRGRRFGVVLDLQRLLKTGLISRWTRAPVRVGFARRDAKELNWLFNNCHIPTRKPGQSKLSMYLEFGKLFGITEDRVEWNFALDREERERVERLVPVPGEKYAAFFIGSSWPSKRWTASATAEAVDAVWNRWKMDVALLGAKSDREFANEIASSCGRGFLDLVGKTSLRDLIGILERASFSLGPDTGTMHLSAAVGTPVVSLWSPTDPVWSAPFGCEDLIVRSSAPCRTCMRRTCRYATPCMAGISHERVMAKIDLALARMQGGSSKWG